MTKMTKAQRAATLTAYANGGFYPTTTNASMLARMHAAGYAVHRLDARGVELSSPTRAGLIAAGVDVDAIHAEALREDEAREVARAGAIVQRRGEVGPGFPIGRVTSVAPGAKGPMVNVSFNGLPGLWADPSFYVLAPQEARDAHSSDYWERATAGVERRSAFERQADAERDARREAEV